MAGALERAVRIEQARSERPNLWVFFHVCDELFDGAWFDKGVAVEKQDVGSQRKPDGLVIGGAEADIAVVADHMDTRELACDRLRAAVCGGIVHHDDLRWRFQCRMEFLQASERDVASVVADDDDGDERWR